MIDVVCALLIVGAVAGGQWAWERYRRFLQQARAERLRRSQLDAAHIAGSAAAVTGTAAGTGPPESSG